MTKSTSRRAMLAGAAAVTVATPVVALATVNPDAELIALGKKFDLIAAELGRFYQSLAVTWKHVERLTPAIPESLRTTAEDRRLGLPYPCSCNTGEHCYGHNDVDRLSGIDNPRARQIVRDYKWWNDAHEQAIETAGYDEDSEVRDQLYEGLAPVNEAIINLPAHSSAGWQVKARAAYFWMVGDIADSDSAGENGRVLRSLLRDMMQAQGITPTTDFEYTKCNPFEQLSRQT